MEQWMDVLIVTR